MLVSCMDSPVFLTTDALRVLGVRTFGPRATLWIQAGFEEREIRKGKVLWPAT